MKQVSEKMNAHLNGSKHFLCADVYELRLRDGVGYFLTDADVDVSYNGRLYRHDEMILMRTQIKTMSRVAVDKMTVTIYADESDKIGAKPVNEFAHGGGFDRARLYLNRIFFDDNHEPIGHVSLFGGVVEVSKAGGLAIKLTVKAETQGLNMPFPRRRYYPQAPYGGIAGKDSGTALIAPFVPTSLSLY